jgi:hypothetical protein
MKISFGTKNLTKLGNSNFILMPKVWLDSIDSKKFEIILEDNTLKIVPILKTEKDVQNEKRIY